MSFRRILFYIAAVLYFGIGALCHVVFVGFFFNPSSMASWGVLLGWPVVLFVSFLLIGFAFSIIACFALWLIDTVGSMWRSLWFVSARRHNEFLRKRGVRA